LLLGGLPQSPPHNVERKEKVEYDLLHCVHLYRQLHKGVYIAFACMCGVNSDLHCEHVGRVKMNFS
jgi:hypothetical protein